MTYSCSDFTDTVLDALKDEIKREYDPDSPSDQADAVLEALNRMEKREQALIAALRECVTENGAYAMQGEVPPDVRRRIEAINAIASAAIAKATSGGA